MHPPLPQGAIAILQAARELFSRDGYGAVSVNAIAERAGVSKANVFHHFGTKENLYVAVLREVCAPEAQFSQALMESPGRAADKLQRLFEFEVMECYADASRSRLFFREIEEIAATPEATERLARQLAEQVWGQGFSCNVELIRTGQRSGEFRTDVDPAIVAILIPAVRMFFSKAHPVVRHMPELNGAGDAASLGRQICQLLLQGLMRQSPPAVQPDETPD